MNRSTINRRTLAAATTAALAFGLLGAGPAAAGDRDRGHDSRSNHQEHRDRDRGHDRDRGKGHGHDKDRGKGHGKGWGHGHGHGHGWGWGHDKDKKKRTVPESKISIQLFSYLGWQQEIGIDGILDELDEIGYKNVEPFGSPGGFGSYEEYTAAEFRSELRDHGMRAPSSHGSTDEATFDETLANAEALGQKWVGSGGWAAPGIARDGSSTYEDVAETAETMNRLGKRSVRNGTGKIFGHNHEWEFTTQIADPDTGEVKSAWEHMVELTDPRYVTFQLDTLWAADAGYDVADLIEEHGDRIELLHIKDGDLNGDERGVPTDVGEGDLEWGPILRAAHGHVKLYIVERDGAPNSAEFAEDSFEFLSTFKY